MYNELKNESSEIELGGAPRQETQEGKPHNSKQHDKSIYNKLQKDSPKVVLGGAPRTGPDPLSPEEDDYHERRRGSTAYDAIAEAMKNQQKNQPKIELQETDVAFRAETTPIVSLDESDTKQMFANGPLILVPVGPHFLKSNQAQQALEGRSADGVADLSNRAFKLEVPQNPLSNHDAELSSREVNELKVPAPPLLNRDDLLLKVPPHPLQDTELSAREINNLEFPPQPLLKRNSENLNIPAPPMKRNPDQIKTFEVPPPLMKRTPDLIDNLKVPAPPMKRESFQNLPTNPNPKQHTVLYNYAESLRSDKTGALYEVATLCMVIGISIVSCLYVLSKHNVKPDEQEYRVDFQLDFKVIGFSVRYTQLLLVCLVAFLEKFGGDLSMIGRVIKTIVFGPRSDYLNFVAQLLGIYKIATILLFPNIKGFLGAAGALLLISAPYFILTSSIWQNSIMTTNGVVIFQEWLLAGSTFVQVVTPIMYLHSQSYDSPYVAMFVTVSAIALSLAVSKHGVVVREGVICHRNLDAIIMRLGFILAALVSGAAVMMDSRHIEAQTAEGVAVRSTIIARVADGVPLAASMDDEESSDLTEYKTQAKSIFKRLSPDSDLRCSIETGGSFVFHYLIEFGVCYLTLCDRSYPKKLAFAYLEELQKEFHEKYGNEVASVARPYAFVKFDTFIQKTKKQYKDTRTQKNLNKLNDDLQDVTRIMTKNIGDVLGRGEQLDRMATMSGNLASQSKKYMKDSKKLNMQALYQKYGPPAILVGIVLFVLLLRFYLF
ncbi:UNVERIFIED_CONTAM: SNAP receptor [Siphonaria sp. JEL0065]|nr:SNAP receptor [Siphonaria sp. JEL0065]